MIKSFLKKIIKHDIYIVENHQGPTFSSQFYATAGNLSGGAMKNVGNSAGNGLHITKDKKPLASTPLRKHNFNFGFKMLQVRLSEGNSKRRRKGIFSSQVICIKSKGRMITVQVHYCVKAHCTYFTVHIFSSKQPKQPCVCPAFYAKSVHQEFP